MIRLNLNNFNKIKLFRFKEIDLLIKNGKSRI
jgi:hypothetical protein